MDSHSLSMEKKKEYQKLLRFSLEKKVLNKFLKKKT